MIEMSAIALVIAGVFVIRQHVLLRQVEVILADMLTAVNDVAKGKAEIITASDGNVYIKSINN